MGKREVTIENWAVVRSSQYPSFEELRTGVHLMGYATGHVNLPDLSFIYTSRVVSVDNLNGVVETSNTLYRLGQPDETYRAWLLAAADTVSEERNLPKTAA
jgi:hypothetical protein